MCRYVRYTGAFDISVHTCEHTLRRVCTYARVCAVCSLAWGDEVGGVQLVYVGYLLLAWGVVFDLRKIGVFSIFDRG